MSTCGECLVNTCNLISEPSTKRKVCFGHSRVRPGELRIQRNTHTHTHTHTHTRTYTAVFLGRRAVLFVYRFVFRLSFGLFHLCLSFLLRGFPFHQNMSKFIVSFSAILSSLKILVAEMILRTIQVWSCQNSFWLG